MVVFRVNASLAGSVMFTYFLSFFVPLFLAPQNFLLSLILFSSENLLLIKSHSHCLKCLYFSPSLVIFQFSLAYVDSYFPL